MFPHKVGGSIDLKDMSSVHTNQFVDLIKQQFFWEYAENDMANLKYGHEFGR